MKEVQVQRNGTDQREKSSLLVTDCFLHTVISIMNFINLFL